MWESGHRAPGVVPVAEVASDYVRVGRCEKRVERLEALLFAEDGEAQ